MSASIVWLRQDLRLADNPALRAAIERGAPVVPVWIAADEGEWTPGAASRWWQHESLRALDEALRARGSRLVLRRGPTLEALRELLSESGATAVYWNRRYEPEAVAHDALVKRTLREQGIDAESFNGALLREPWEIRNQSGGAYRIYSAFRRRLLEQLDPEPPTAVPERLPAPKRWPSSLDLEALELLPRIPWYRTMAESWRPGEAGGQTRLREFLARPIADYARTRDLPGIDGSSRLSPHLHFGELSPRSVWHAARDAARGQGLSAEEWCGSVLASELLWREFAHHLLYHFPRTAQEPLDRSFEHFDWRQDARQLRAWQRGRTGVPIVDAGMRQLWAMGWMHNRVRMIVASFLVKNLRIHWLEGARWFWDTLVDADLAANTLNWQWSAGSGADAAPYFRIFNPVSQSRKFVPDGAYLRRWLPELARLPTDALHAPWLARPHELDAAGVRLGVDYPEPIVDLGASRAAALEAYRAMRARRR